jgi:flagellar basal-body rod modification protein FlgD
LTYRAQPPEAERIKEEEMIAALQPAKPSSTASQSSGTTTSPKDQFLRLLVTQLQHQDPLKPMEAQEFTAQLAQFSAVEQAIQTNELLKTLTLYGASSNNAQAAGLIGKEITATGNSVILGDQGTASIGFCLKGDAAQTQVNLYDASGKLVRAILMGSLKTGDQTLSWDGKDQGGRVLANGTYRVEVLAQDAKGKAVEVEQYLRGRVESALFQNNSTQVVVGGVSVPLGNILEVRG